MNDNLLKCRTIHLRLAKEQDANFIYSLRVNNKLNKYISNVTGSVEDQRLWLQNYKEKEEKNNEFYFIVVRNDNENPVGTIRIYGITEDNRFCWGSWILNEDKTTTAALESAYLIYKFAFEIMNYDSAYFQVDNENKSVIAFHLKTGAIFKHQDDKSEHFEFHIDAYNNLKKRYTKLIEA